MRRIAMRYSAGFRRAAIVCATGPSLNLLSENVMKDLQEYADIFSVNHFPLTKLGRTTHTKFQVMADDTHSMPPGDPAELEFQRYLYEDFKGVLVSRRHQVPDFRGERVIIRGLSAPSLTRCIDPFRVVGFPHYTTMYAIALAIQLEYKPIIVVGLDLNHHKALRILDGVAILDQHHSYESFAQGQPWKGRKKASQVLVSNAFAIDALKLFREKDVWILGNEGSIDTLPRIDIDKATLLLQRYLL